ncbi:MAG: hypothetical protein KF774_07960 [Planctomyces sp.]|nr:hypothetical protein [Planctomyces sp.]
MFVQPWRRWSALAQEIAIWARRAPARDRLRRFAQRSGRYARDLPILATLLYLFGIVLAISPDPAHALGGLPIPAKWTLLAALAASTAGAALFLAAAISSRLTGVRLWVSWRSSPSAPGSNETNAARLGLLHLGIIMAYGGVLATVDSGAMALSLMATSICLTLLALDRWLLASRPPESGGVFIQHKGPDGDPPETWPSLVPAPRRPPALAAHAPHPDDDGKDFARPQSAERLAVGFEGRLDARR